MRKSGVTTKVELDPETDLDFKRWAAEEGRSKRRQIAVVMRRIVGIRKQNPDELRRLQLAH